MSLASLTSMAQCMWVRPGAYLIVKHLKGASLRLALVLPTNITLGWKVFSGDKHSCLSSKSVNYQRKKIYRIGPWMLL